MEIHTLVGTCGNMWEHQLFMKELWAVCSNSSPLFGEVKGGGGAGVGGHVAFPEGSFLKMCGPEKLFSPELFAGSWGATLQ